MSDLDDECNLELAKIVEEDLFLYTMVIKDNIETIDALIKSLPTGSEARRDIVGRAQYYAVMKNRQEVVWYFLEEHAATLLTPSLFDTALEFNAGDATALFLSKNVAPTADGIRYAILRQDLKTLHKLSPSGGLKALTWAHLPLAVITGSVEMIRFVHVVTGKCHPHGEVYHVAAITAALTKLDRTAVLPVIEYMKTSGILALAAAYNKKHNEWYPLESDEAKMGWVYENEQVATILISEGYLIGWRVFTSALKIGATNLCTLMIEKGYSVPIDVDTVREFLTAELLSDSAFQWYAGILKNRGWTIETTATLLMGPPTITASPLTPHADGRVFTQIDQFLYPLTDVLQCAMVIDTASSVNGGRFPGIMKELRKYGLDYYGPPSR